MGEARFRFYAELNDFLPPESRARDLVRRFHARAPVKDLIESFGVPHTEVEVVLANSEPVDFDYVVSDGDRVSVYPVFESLDVRPVRRVREEPLRELSFVLDVHLGRLAAYLRMAGFDAAYQNHLSDPELAFIVASERRVLLTRDRGLLMRNQVDRGYYVRATDAREQLVEVLQRFDLSGSIRPFTRCLRCNGLLQPAGRSLLEHGLPQGAEKHAELLGCRDCQGVYWKGSHYDRMCRLLEWVKAQLRTESRL